MHCTQQGTSQVLRLSTGSLHKVLSLSTRPEVPWYTGRWSQCLRTKRALRSYQPGLSLGCLPMTMMTRAVLCKASQYISTVLVNYPDNDDVLSLSTRTEVP
jgi:hypothetical protein